MKQLPVTAEMLARWDAANAQCKRRRLAERALSKCDLNDVMFNNTAAAAMRQKFSLELDTLPVTNQKASGRCWLFAAANVLRENIAKEKNMANFELSQSWLAFWDKFERANYFLQAMMDTAELPHDDRTVSFVLSTGVHDGGQWDMFANIVRKYGIVPKDVFDETHQSSNTRPMNYYVNRFLKARAAELRRMVQAGKPEEEVQAEKEKALEKIYAFLCSCYGVPPKSFDFEYVDKDKQYHIETGYTPETFRDKYVGDLLDKTVSIINAPTADKPYHKTFTIRLLGNVIGGKPVVHLNLTMDEFKQAILNQLNAGKVVWFGSDVGHFGDRAMGIWDNNCFDAELVTGMDLGISKADALEMGLSAMNHAMVLTGVNMKDGKPDRWRIENSWGDEKGQKGYYICSDDWFNQYVYQAAVEREYLGDLAKYADETPVELAPWDPMGTLAD